MSFKLNFTHQRETVKQSFYFKKYKVEYIHFFSVKRKITEALKLAKKIRVDESSQILRNNSLL